MPWLTRKAQVARVIENYEKNGIRNHHYDLRIRYYKNLHRAWPEWSDDRRAYAAIYKECARRRARREDVVVDHVVPLRGTLVCGLHVPWNLSIITSRENIEKGNKWWPDGPFEQQRMALDTNQTEQRSLDL